MKIHYTVTTKKCPNCGTILDEESNAGAAMLSIFTIFLFPALIPYWLIKFIGFKSPIVPKIGPPIEECPSCRNPYLTEMCELEDLEGIDLLNYRFRIWFSVCYVLGAIFGFDLAFLLGGDQSIISIEGMIGLLALLGVLAIIIVYRLKLARIQS